MEALQGNNRVLADEMDRMERRLEELQTEVEGFTSREKISSIALDKICTEMLASNDFLDMQLALEVGMAKRIRRKLIKELKDFDPKLLIKEYMFEEEEAESRLETSENYLSKFVLSVKRRKDKTFGAKPLVLEKEPN